MRSAAPCAHINSSVRRGPQAVPAKMPRIGSGASATAHAITFRNGLGVWQVRVLDQLVQLASEENGVVQPDVPVWLGHLRHPPGQPSPRARRQTTTQAAAGSTARSMDPGHHVRMSGWRVLGVDACKAGGSGSPCRKGRSAPTPRQESVILSRTLAAAAAGSYRDRHLDRLARHGTPTATRITQTAARGLSGSGCHPSGDARRLSGHPGGLARASRAFRFCFNRAFRPWFRRLALARV